MSKVPIIGLGDDGLPGLTPSARDLVQQAELVVGEAGTLAVAGELPGERFVVAGDLDAAVRRIDESRGRRVVVLASGDPLFYGLARYLCERLGKDRFEVVPHVSSMQLAFARVKESWDDAYLANLASQDLRQVVEKTRTAQKVGLFTTEASPPAAVARALLDREIDYFTAYVCENLGSPDERVTAAALSELADLEFSPLNVMVLIRRPGAPDRPRSMAGRRLFGNRDDMFLQSLPQRGLLTPGEVRVIALSELDLGPASVVWDVGAGSGSVAIEAAQLAPEGRVFAIEMSPDDHRLIADNAVRFGVANLVPVLGQAPHAWESLPDPDAVFVGGTGRAVQQLVELAFARLKPGGRLVANVGSIENVAAVHETLQRLAGDCASWMVQISRGNRQLDRLRFDSLPPTFLLGAVKG